ncbi:MAG: hypothetical protein RR847_02825, partial [Bacilli bacterium]
MKSKYTRVFTTWLLGILKLNPSILNIFNIYIYHNLQQNILLNYPSLTVDAVKSSLGIEKY